MMNSASFPVNDDGTFLVNPVASHDAGGGDASRQRPPVSAADFNHMFSPLTIERMFQRGPEFDDSNGDTQNSTSIMKLLWNSNNTDSNREAGDGSLEGAGDTLKQLLSNGSNPLPAPSREQQERQEQFMALVESESLITPSSPPETVASHGSAQDDIMAYPSSVYSQPISGGSLRRANSSRVASVLTQSASGTSSLAHRRSVQHDGRHLPPIPRSPQLRPSSRISFASYGSTSGNMRNYALQVPATARPAGMAGDHVQNQQRYLVNRPGSSRPAAMYDVGAAADFNSHPLQIHSAVVPGTRYPYQHHQPERQQSPKQQAQALQQQQQQSSQADMSLRHEVLDKAVRKSQPTTPFDMQGSAANNLRPPSSAAIHRPGSSMDYTLPQHQVYNTDEITMLPGDSRLRAYAWSQNNSPQYNANGNPDIEYQRPRQNQLKSSNSYTSGLNRPASAARFGSIRKNDPAALSQVRKASDSSAHLLTPKDFNAPLPERVGDMVLDKRLGEWVHINEYMLSSGRGNEQSIAQQQQQSQQLQQQQQPDGSLNGASRGPASGRSSVSVHSHTSAFPQPLPTDNRGRNSTIGMGLVSPVENQRVVVREMAERKSGRRDSAVNPRPIEDEALGSIVQRLITPVASPGECTALDLSGSGIRNLSGLAQITARLESICLASNKLQSLAGLPTGLVSLRAPSNWIRFSHNDADKFNFARELPHLEEIDLSANEISDISVFSGLRHLRVLELNRNRIESLQGLCGCRRLLQLGLRDNIVTQFDLEASEVPLLNTLDMFNNRLRVVPAAISEFTHLVKANMIRNDLELVDLHGTPAEAIRELRLSENPLLMRRCSGVVDVSMWRAKFPNLKTLYLDICNIRQLAQSLDRLANDAGNQVSADAPIVAWSSLFNLSLRGNALQPLLAVDFACLANLKNLYAPDTHMALPRSMPTMNHLLQLVICNAGICRLPVNFGSALPQLRLFDVSNNPELFDLQPILQLAPSLEVLKCRAVGFGDGNISIPGVHSFPDIPNDNNNGALSAGPESEITLLRMLSKLRRLRRLDLRFNRCTADLYAPPPTLTAQSLQSGSGGAGGALSLDGALSPQMAGQGGAMADGSGAPGAQSSARIDEDAWLRQDHAYMASLKLTRQSQLLQRRDNYWATAVSLFPRLEELDGIKVSSSAR